MNRIKRLGMVCAIAASAATLGACVDDYGYGGVAVGYGAAAGPGYNGYGAAPGAGYNGYEDGYYGAYGDPYYGAGYPGYYGWYGGFYYPGSGLYVFDRDRRPYRWNGDQRRYWGGQQRGYRGGANGFTGRAGANWNGFNRAGAGAGTNASRGTGQAFRGAGGGGGGRSGGHARQR